jgi:anaerobic magnesium-protoporphyrin IX monomethyl ester cyclase
MDIGYIRTKKFPGANDMNKILFSHSYFMRFDPKQWSLGQPYPPLGTLYAAALLRENEYPVSLFDTMFAKQPDEVMNQINGFNPNIFVIYDDGFNYLTKMCLTNMRNAAFRMAKLAKGKGCTVIISGSDSTDHYAEYIAQGADFILLGEGEMTLLELINALERKESDFSKITGLAFLKDGVPVKNAGRAVLKDLDALPIPAWDLIDMDIYRKTWLNHAGYFSLNMSTTRGCPFKCNWCAKPIYGNRYNARSPSHVVTELIWLHERYKFDHIWFCDDIFGLKPGWIREFSELIEKGKLRFSFKIQARADLLLQEDDIRYLARAGCNNVWMGAESGSQKILDAMDKGTTIAQIRESTRLLKSHGIKPSFFIQFGYPGETKEDIECTIRMINELLPHEIGISVSYPLPGTLFYEKVKDELVKKANWTDSDEMAMMFRNTYPASFYKSLHKYVHKNYRKHLAFENLSALVNHPGKSSFHQIKKALTLFYYIPATLIEKQKLNKKQKRPVDGFTSPSYQ